MLDHSGEGEPGQNPPAVGRSLTNGICIAARLRGTAALEIEKRRRKKKGRPGQNPPTPGGVGSNQRLVYSGAVLGGSTTVNKREGEGEG